MTEPKKSIWKRLPRPKFRLRTLMLIVLVLAIGPGWIFTKARRRAETIERIDRARGSFESDGLVTPGIPWKMAPPRWMVERFGADCFRDVTQVKIPPRTEKLDDSFLARLSELENLERLEIDRAANISDDGFAVLSGLTGLKHLLFSGNGISGRALIHLRRMKQLEDLVIEDVVTEDADLAYLSGLGELTALHLQGDKLTDQGLAHLQSLKKMKRLAFSTRARMEVTTAGLACFSGMTGLLSLTIPLAKVESLEPIRNLTSLTILQVDDAYLDDEGLSPLANLQSLELLTLSGKTQRFSDDGMAYLFGLTNLDFLRLNDTQIGDAGLARLGRLKRLDAIELDGTPITDGGVFLLSRLPRLSSLSLNRTTITDQVMHDLILMPHFQRISIKQTRVSSLGIAYLKWCVPGIVIEH
jgi:internalin A